MNKKILTILSVFLLLCGGLYGGFLWLTWSGEPREVTAEINKFNAPSDWKLVKETVYPKRHACLGDQPCDAIVREWDTGDRVYSQSELNDLLEESGLPVRIERECKQYKTTNFSCSGKKEIDTMYQSVYYSRENNSNLLTFQIVSIN